MMKIIIRVKMKMTTEIKKNISTMKIKMMIKVKITTTPNENKKECT